MKKKISIVIDGRKYQVLRGQTILQIAKEHNLAIPYLCYHPDLKASASCGICLVEVVGEKKLKTACSVKVKPQMKIITSSSKIEAARKSNLARLFIQHQEECPDCVWQPGCQLLKLAKEYNLDRTRLEEKKKNYPVYQFGPALIFDSSKCIECGNCLEICRQQGVDFLQAKKTGTELKIIPSRKKNKDCVYCGQCLIHCPAGCFEAVGEFGDSFKPFEQKNRIIIVQIAPSIRTSVSKEFDLPSDQSVMGKLAAGLKQLGAHYVFDTSFGADFTTTEEANELIERLKGEKSFPLFTSCCPSWVKFVEFYYPEFISCLATTRSPQIILGGLIKTYWARKEKINPKKIIVVSVMPCVAKKYEITQNSLKIKKLKPVDFVITTRELIHLFKKKNVDLKNIKSKEMDLPFESSSGAGVIYGATGGVMESVLRTALEKMSEKSFDERLKLERVRGLEGIKKLKIKIRDKMLKIAVVHGLGRAKIILEELKKNPQKYDYLEIMACPGGCVGGGGQPLPLDNSTRISRAEGLRQLDAKNKDRLAHKNQTLVEVYQKFLNKKTVIQDICHRRYFKKGKDLVKIFF